MQKYGSSNTFYICHTSQSSKCGRSEVLSRNYTFRNETRNSSIISKKKIAHYSRQAQRWRKLFSNPKLASKITGINENLIHRCTSLLQAIASGYKINVLTFNEYALFTARELIKEYPWYYLPATVHKVLIHGSAVIEHALVSIGELSEEAVESNNKELKKFRLYHSRKTSRIATNIDILNSLLLGSDPFITGQRKLEKKDKITLLDSVYGLLEETL